MDTADGWLAKLKYLHFKSELLIQDLHKKRTKLFYVLYNSMPIVIQIHIQGAGQCQCPRSGQVSLLCTSPILTSISIRRWLAGLLLVESDLYIIFCFNLKNLLRQYFAVMSQLESSMCYAVLSIVPCGAAKRPKCA